MAHRTRGKAGPGATVAHIVDLLAGWWRVDARRMFSGYGLFRDGLMFGIVIRDVLYFKTNDDNRGDYETAGMAPFRYRRGARRVALGYHEVPAAALDDGETLAAWAQKAYAAAVRKAAGKPTRATAKNKRMPRVPDTIDLAALVRGSKAQWDAFVRRYVGLIVSAVRSQARDAGEVEDLVQEVFVRLCKDGYRLLKTYDPARAGLSTWLTIVARSTARDILRRRQPLTTPYEAVPESALAVTAEPTERIKLPEGLLSPRQKLILTMLYDRDMEVAEIAAALKVDPQTIRSTHHKAMLKLREHFAPENPAKPGVGRG